MKKKKRKIGFYQCDHHYFKRDHKPTLGYNLDEELEIEFTERDCALLLDHHRLFSGFVLHEVSSRHFFFKKHVPYVGLKL